MNKALELVQIESGDLASTLFKEKTISPVAAEYPLLHNLWCKLIFADYNSLVGYQDQTLKGHRVCFYETRSD